MVQIVAFLVGFLEHFGTYLGRHFVNNLVQKMFGKSTALCVRANLKAQQQQQRSSSTHSRLIGGQSKYQDTIF